MKFFGRVLRKITASFLYCCVIIRAKNFWLGNWHEILLMRSFLISAWLLPGCVRDVHGETAVRGQSECDQNVGKEGIQVAHCPPFHYHLRPNPLGQTLMTSSESIFSWHLILIRSLRLMFSRWAMKNDLSPNTSSLSRSHKPNRQTACGKLATLWISVTSQPFWMLCKRFSKTCVCLWVLCWSWTQPGSLTPLCVTTSPCPFS